MVHIQSHVAKLSVHFRHRSHLRNHAIASTCKQASFRTQTSADARTHTHPHTHTHTHTYTHTHTHTHTLFLLVALLLPLKNRNLGKRLLIKSLLKNVLIKCVPIKVRHERPLSRCLLHVGWCCTGR